MNLRGCSEFDVGVGFGRVGGGVGLLEGGGEGLGRAFDLVCLCGGSCSSSESSSGSEFSGGKYVLLPRVVTRIFASPIFFFIVTEIIFASSFSACSMALTSCFASKSPCMEMSCLAQVAGYLDMASATMFSGPGK